MILFSVMKKEYKNIKFLEIQRNESIECNDLFGELKIDTIYNNVQK